MLLLDLMLMKRCKVISLLKIHTFQNITIENFVGLIEILIHKHFARPKQNLLHSVLKNYYPIKTNLLTLLECLLDSWKKRGSPGCPI